VLLLCLVTVLHSTALQTPHWPTDGRLHRTVKVDLTGQHLTVNLTSIWQAVNAQSTRIQQWPAFNSSAISLPRHFERHVYKLLVLPWQQLITNLTRDNSANENARNTLVGRHLNKYWLNMTYVGETKTSLTCCQVDSGSVDGQVDLTLKKRTLTVRELSLASLQGR